MTVRIDFINSIKNRSTLIIHILMNKLKEEKKKRENFKE